jgi:hypothetical protein
LQFSTPRGGSEQTFTFDTGSVNAFGINVGDLATVGHSTLVLETSNGDSMSWRFPDQRRGTDKFFGIFDSMNDFISITITNSDSGDAVGLDDARWASVPEPTSVALLGLGLVGLGVSRKRQSETA